VADVLELLKGVEFDVNTSNFWILTKAIKEFIDSEGNGQMPVGGEVPDMTSTTESYVKLQQIYHDKAIADLNAVSQRVAAILSSIGAPVNKIDRSESELESRLVCFEMIFVCLILLCPFIGYPESPVLFFICLLILSSHQFLSCVGKKSSFSAGMLSICG
jgi:hypothetical protein